MLATVNPLDSTLIQKRGKEREKPRNKKQSTLKKIIIKEREEKRRLRQDQLKTSDDLSLDIVGLNSPMAGTVELILSPRSHTQIVKHDSHSNSKLEEKSELPETDENKVDKEVNGEVAEKAVTNPVAEEEEEEVNEANTEEEVEEADDDEQEEHENTGEMSNQMSPISQGSPISIGGYSPSPYAALNSMAVDRTLLSLEKLEEQVKQKIHSRKFREYCNQIINRDMDEVCISLLHDIARFQDRLYHKNPTKVSVRELFYWPIIIVPVTI